MSAFACSETPRWQQAGRAPLGVTAARLLRSCCVSRTCSFAATIAGKPSRRTPALLRNRETSSVRTELSATRAGHTTPRTPLNGGPLLQGTDPTKRSLNTQRCDDIDDG